MNLADWKSNSILQIMIHRLMTRLIRERLEVYPAVALVGPRQSGKTTLARSLDGIYFDLERETDRLRLDIEWETVMASGRLLIFDEAQEMPVLFSRLRSAIDEQRQRNGRFLLLGSLSQAPGQKSQVLLA